MTTPETGEFSQLNSGVCGAVWHEAWTCTLAPHEGEQHRAYVSGVLVASWLGDQRSDESKMGDIILDAIDED